MSNQKFYACLRSFCGRLIVCTSTECPFFVLEPACSKSSENAQKSNQRVPLSASVQQICCEKLDHKEAKQTQTKSPILKRPVCQQSKNNLNHLNVEQASVQD